MLSPYRVLDLTDDRGLLCGQMLADLGADVIQIEPPGGFPARRLGPFRGGVPDPEGSLYWWAYARNKRSLVLDIDTPEGKATLRRLAATADFLIESAGPGALDRRGLGYGDLRSVNPALVYVSISAFGGDGPKAHDAASDLVLLAAGGALAITGDQDRPPVRITAPQAWLHAAADAAVGALIAHHERIRSGRGQHVDVSAQQSVTLATQSTILAHAVGFMPVQRCSGGVRMGPLQSRLVYPARDGFVSITFLFGSAIGAATRRLMEYIHEQGGCDAATRDKDWLTYFELLLTGQESFEEYERVKEVVAAFTAARTKAELLAAALERDLLIAPVATVPEVAASEQLAHREYFQTHDAPGGSRAVRHVGPFAKFSRSPIRYRRRAPTIGEHGPEILAGLEVQEREASRADARGTGATAGALADVRVLDLMWAVAGPASTRMLADYGATVVRVESPRRVDVCRTMPPFSALPPGGEYSALFHSMNAGKRMVTLDLGSAEGRAVMLDLVRWADVVTESFTPQVLRRLGLDYEALRAVRSDVIMLSTCLMGQTGPLATFAGFGNLAGAITGFYELCGWPDRAPAGPFGAYTDYVSPKYCAAAILAALEHRRRTGEGQYIDLAQAEASLHFLAPAILDHHVNGRASTRAGNDDRVASPHGVYPASGEDRWVAITVADDVEWRGLCAAMNRPDLGADPRFATPAARHAAADALDAAVTSWTRDRVATEIAALLQQHGVPASPVQTSPDLCDDPQLRHRGHFITLSHPEGVPAVAESTRLRLSRTPARVDGVVPTLGRDTQAVLADVLGYDEDRITALVVSGALG